MKKTILLVSVLKLFSTTAFSQSQEGDSVMVMAKIWSKDENKQVHYSDWKTFSAFTVDGLKGFNPSKTIPTEKTHLSRTDKKGSKTGFFHTEKKNGRWWVVDPNGYYTYVTAVNGIRTLKTTALPEKFAGIDDWAKQTIVELDNNGFNTAGCWSDTASIIAYNRTTTNPISYTTQLSLLSSYASETKKQYKHRKDQSNLSFIMDDDFPAFCREKCKLLKSTLNDRNLLGHFSDNEIGFTVNELKDILQKKNEIDKAYLFCRNYANAKGWDLDSLTKEQKQVILGEMAGTYFSIVYKAIKDADPNHLYLGSRIHSNAKNNPYIFKYFQKYTDIISINYYGDWQTRADYINDWATWCDKPFFITEFYTKAEETGMNNHSGAGWIVKTQKDRGLHYQNFCLTLLKAKNCVGWHWFRYQDNDPNDAKADDSNKDSNKGIMNLQYEYYEPLMQYMKALNSNVYSLIDYFDSQNTK